MYCILTHPIDNPKKIYYIMRCDIEGYRIREFDTEKAAKEYMEDMNENRADFGLDILEYCIQKV